MNAIFCPASYRVSDVQLVDPPAFCAEPDESHYNTGFDQLVANTEEFASFLEEQDTRTIATAFQLFHDRGLPAMDKSVRSDRLSDAYEASFGGVISAYRAWLERNGKLQAAALRVMEAEAEEARLDAAEAAAGY